MTSRAVGAVTLFFAVSASMSRAKSDFVFVVMLTLGALGVVKEIAS